MIEEHPSVEWAEPMEVYETLARKGKRDPLTRLSPLASAWDLARVHSSWTGRNVSVAVIDTHVDAGHPDLKGRIKVARNFTPQAQIMALRACWQRGSNRASACTSLNLARAMNYAIERGAKIINLSRGGPPNRLLT